MGLDLNVDLGELPEEPEELYTLATTVNLACGGHAGDQASMARALSLAARSGARVAAHPSYPDVGGFGRRARFSDPDATRDAVATQCRALRKVAKVVGVELAVVKPHGALYHDASNDADYAAALIDGARRALPELTTIVGFPDTALEDIVRVRGLCFEREGFADRRYDHHFKLVPRSEPDAVLIEPAACVTQALLLARMRRIDTLCIHGDNPGAVGIAREVRAALAGEGLITARP